MVTNRAPGVPHGPPAFLDNCAFGNPRATSLVEGTSVGYTDIYPAYFHGQSIDITRVPAGQYLLVNRVNPFLRFHELRYDNNAAALAVRLRWAFFASVIGAANSASQVLSRQPSISPARRLICILAAIHEIAATMIRPIAIQPP